jgi:hypothetical protein
MSETDRKSLDEALAVVVLLVFGFVFLWCGISSVNFGVHWDEIFVTTSLHKIINSGILLPDSYNHSSLTYLIALITALTHLPAVAAESGGTSLQNSTQLLTQYIDSISFWHLLRAVFVVLTASTALFVVLSARAVGLGSLPAAVSGAVVLGSLEVFYHARWVVPDTLLMLAAAMTLVTALWAARNQQLLLFLLSAACAGLATAAKYPGGCLLLLPLIAAARNPSFFSRAVCMLAVFIATYFLLNPGTFVDPVRFVRDVHYEMLHYRYWGHHVYTVAAGWQHLSKMLDFLAFRLVSPYLAVSALATAAALAGSVVVWRRDRRTALLLTLIPVLYIAYMATNRVMIIRNLLIIMPFVAVLAGVAVDALTGLIRPRIARGAVPLTAVLLLLVLNWPRMFYAMESLRDADPDAWRQQIQAYIAAHSDRRFAASPQVAALLSSAPEGSSVEVHTPESADAYFFMLGEYKSVYASSEDQFKYGRLANSRNLYQVVAGPDDVDLDYYPDWSGPARVVTVDGQTASLLTGRRFAGK